MVTTQSFSPGARIFREGEPGNCAFIIERGSVQITALKNGEELPLAKLGPGDLFGEMALIDDDLRNASATALEETDLIVVQRDYFRGCVENADPILHVFLRVVLDRFRVTHEVRISGREAAAGHDEHPGGPDRQRVLKNLKEQRRLELALENRELALHYQPIVALASGQCVGFEALLRWQHPRLGLLAPGRFIGLAEKIGLIVPIGLWALHEAAQALERFQEIQPSVSPAQPPLFMSVNLSGRQLTNLRDVDAILGTLSASGIDPASLHLEITESLLMEDPQMAAESLRRLKKAGVALSIDDFGTGYSSLGYLHRFPIDHLKLDRSFIDSMIDDRSSMKIVRSVSRMARDLGMAMVAEGIETPEQLKVLRELECEYAQGYLFSRPAAAEAFTGMLKSRQPFFGNHTTDGGPERGSESLAGP